MSANGFVTEMTALLTRTPEVLRVLLAGLPEAWTDTPDATDGWRPRDVVGHLITGEEADWIPRTRRILEQGTSVPFDRFDRFAMLERDAGIPLDDLVERFAVLRRANLAALGQLELPQPDCYVAGRHSITILNTQIFGLPSPPRGEGS